MMFGFIADDDLEIADEELLSSSSDGDAELDHLDIADEGPVGQGIFHAPEKTIYYQL